MSPLAGRPFLKMNGIGNEIVVLDLRGADIVVSAQEARAIARGKGLAYDQLMALHDPLTPGAQARLRIYNNDGSLSASCGNGTRCVAFALMRDTHAPTLSLDSDAGLLACRRMGENRFEVDMGAPRLRWDEIPLRDAVADTRNVTLPDAPAHTPADACFSAVSMGNPHAIFFVDDIAAVDLATLGPQLEHHPMFPHRANISIAHVTTPPDAAQASIDLKVWERGAGLTRACGSAACAVAVAAARRGLAGRSATIRLPGGELDIVWRAGDDHVLMTGDVELEFEGVFEPALFARADA